MKNKNTIIFKQFALAIAIVLFISTESNAMVYTLDLALAGHKEVPANGSNATGTLIGTYDDVTNVLNFSLKFNGLTTPATAAHFHGPAAAGTNAPVMIGFSGFPTGVTSGTYSNTYTLTATQETHLLCGKMYVNIHNSSFPGGEIRSQLTEGTTSGNISTIDIAMVGSKEVPANASNATGTVIGTFNHTTNVLAFTLKFNGLTANASAGHFHGPATAGANAPVLIGFAGFPTGVTSGVYTNTYTLTPTQKNYLLAGQLYANVHNSSFPGGEIRSQLTEGTLTGYCSLSPSVPTMSQWSLIILSLMSISIGMIVLYKKENVFAFNSRK